MPSRGLNTLTKHQCLMGTRFENLRQAFFESRGNRQKALEAHRNATEIYSRLQWLAQSETEQEVVG